MRGPRTRAGDTHPRPDAVEREQLPSDQHRAGDGSDSPFSAVTLEAVPVEALPSVPATQPSLRERLLTEAQGLAERARALRERYEETRRLADSLELLAGQVADLERSLAGFRRLVEGLEGEAQVAAIGPLFASEPNDRGTGEALEVRCLGAFEIRSQGRPVDLGRSHKGRLIFKYLLTHAPHRQASKELLAELFWPETPVERALPSLQSALHQLRRAMGGTDSALASRPAVVYADGHYRLNPEVWIRSDVDYFRARLVEARAHETRGDFEAARRSYGLAQSAYGGELLPEERYEEWVALERAALEADQASALTRLVQLTMAQGSYGEAIQFGRSLLELDSTREDVHRDLMRCYHRLGQRSEAIRQYRRCCAVLAAELEVQPEAETNALFERLASGEAI